MLGNEISDTREREREREGCEVEMMNCHGYIVHKEL
jgi:hypothetical protein